MNELCRLSKCQLASQRSKKFKISNTYLVAQRSYLHYLPFLSPSFSTVVCHFFSSFKTCIQIDHKLRSKEEKLFIIRWVNLWNREYIFLCEKGLKHCGQEWWKKWTVLIRMYHHQHQSKPLKFQEPQQQVTLFFTLFLYFICLVAKKV